MKALYLDGTGLSLRDVEPPVRKPGEALVRVRMAGICNTDLEIARGYMGFQGILGHEFVGEVHEADDGTLVGTRVAGEINLSCGVCDMCRRGLGRHCEQRTVLGIRNKNGCFADYVTLPTKNLHRVPSHITDRAACFVEPLAACYQILEQTYVGENDRIAILGDGKLGQLLALTLRQHGSDPMLVGKHDRKLALAKERGIRTAKAEDLHPRSFDTVIEATGSPRGMELAMNLLRPRGTLVLKSTYHDRLSLDAAPLVIDEVTLIGSRCGPFPPAIAAIAGGDINPEYLIDASYPISDGLTAMRKAAEPGAMKVLLVMH